MIRAACSLLVVAAGALCGASCGDSDEPLDPENAVAVRVTERVTGDTTFVEGALSFVELSRDGEVVGQDELRDGIAQLVVVPGTYRLRLYLRPCSGNCSTLDPPTAECARQVDLTKHGKYSLVVRHSLEPDANCHVNTRYTAEPTS